MDVFSGGAVQAEVADWAVVRNNEILKTGRWDS